MENESLALRVEALEQRMSEFEHFLKCPLRQEEEETVLRKAAELGWQYGDHTSKTEAARILGVTRATVYAMLADGRIKGAYEGMYVDVRSIAEYMCAMKPKKRRNANEQGIFDRQSDR